MVVQLLIQNSFYPFKTFSLSISISPDCLKYTIKIARPIAISAKILVDQNRHPTQKSSHNSQRILEKITKLKLTEISITDDINNVIIFFTV